MSTQTQDQAGGNELEKQGLKGSRSRMAIAAILAVILIAAAVWYFVFYQKQSNVNPESKPPVSFGMIGLGGPSRNRTVFSIISAASEGLAFSSIKLGLAMNGSPADSNKPLVANVTIPFGSIAKLTVYDQDGDGELTVGDTLDGYGMPAGHSWNLTLLWSDDSLIGWLTWSTWPVSLINFQIQSTPSLWIMTVTDAPGILSLSWVSLTIKNRGGMTVPSMDSIPLENLTAGDFGTHGAQYHQSSGIPMIVAVGDSIDVSKTMYPSGFTYNVSDGYATLANGVFRHGAPIVFSVAITGGNYTISVASAPVGLPVNGTFLTITNDTGVMGPMDSVPLTNLTAANWTTYEVEYRRVGSEDHLVAGASLTVSRTAYPAGCNYTVSDGWEILASGQLTSPHIDFSITTWGRNFTMTVTNTTPGLTLSLVKLTIEDTNHNPQLYNVALSDLTPANWGANGVLYQKIGVETDVVVGASMLVYKPVYSFCYIYTLTNGTDLLADGTLFDCSLPLGMNVMHVGNNWSLTIAALPSGLTNVPLQNITLTILDVSYVVKAPMDSVSFAALTSANWSLYKVVYQSMIPSDYLTIGARVLMYDPVYMTGFYWEMLTGDRCLSVGRFM